MNDASPTPIKKKCRQCRRNITGLKFSRCQRCLDQAKLPKPPGSVGPTHQQGQKHRWTMMPDGANHVVYERDDDCCRTLCGMIGKCTHVMFLPASQVMLKCSKCHAKTRKHHNAHWDEVE